MAEGRPCWWWLGSIQHTFYICGLYKSFGSLQPRAKSLHKTTQIQIKYSSADAALRKHSCGLHLDLELGGVTGDK